MGQGDFNGWRPGEHLLIDDVTGFKVRSSRAKKQWDGAVVDEKVYERRHPQDLIRSRPERPGVIDARPRPPDFFIGPLTTTITVAANAGALTIKVGSTVRMAINDRLSIMLSTGDTFLTVITTIIDMETLNILPKLPASLEVGAAVTDNTAMAQADVG